jgi:orotate phosphoribosyltransferase
MLFGPAYKGITLAAAVAIGLARHGRNVPYAYNRKEAKDHGEGGLIVGTPLEGRVLIIDDVITSGAAIREVMGVVDASPGELAGVIVSVDRQERGSGDISAIGEVERDNGVRVHAIVTLTDVIAYLRETGDHAEHLDAVLEYRSRYGV